MQFEKNTFFNLVSNYIFSHNLKLNNLMKFSIKNFNGIENLLFESNFNSNF